MAWLKKKSIGKAVASFKTHIGQRLSALRARLFPTFNYQDPSSQIALAESKSRSVVFIRGHVFFVTTVLVLYYAVVTMWISNEGPFHNLLVSWFRVPVDAIGIEQGWALFGPGVRTWNGHTVADITFADGSSRIYEFPRMEMMDLFEKLRREKLRKLFNDNMYNDGFEPYLPSFARCIAQANNDPSNPPVTVAFTLKWVDMPYPDEKKWRTRDTFPFQSKTRLVFVYKVKGDDLK